jgi:hypothetical protein
VEVPGYGKCLFLD